MTCCSARVFLLTICVLQVIATIQRQVFDFLGYLWIPIIGNFIHIICVILGFFGSFQYRPKYIICYASWSVLWLIWNIFIICFYLEVGIFRLDSSVLNLGTGGHSWWQTHGFGCRPIYNYTAAGEQLETVQGCILDFQYVEVIHSGIQCLLIIFGFSLACYVIHIFLQEDDSFDFIGGFDSYSAYHSPNKTTHMQLQPILPSESVGQLWQNKSKSEDPRLGPFQANPLNIQIVPRDLPSRTPADVISHTISGSVQPPRPRRPREVKRTSHRSRTKQTYRSPVTRLMDRPPPLPTTRPPPLPSSRPAPIYYPDSKLQFYNISKEIVL